MKIIKGKSVLRFKRECPYYGTGGRTLEKVYFYKFGWSLSRWTIHKDNPNGEFSDEAIEKLKSIFPGCEIVNGRYVDWNGKGYYPMDTRWLFNDKFDWEPTESKVVFFDRKSQKYIGYSHRACQMFGIGDMLFNANKEKVNLDFYYSQPKYRWEFIKTLLHYHLKNDSFGFRNLCEDEIIGHGILNIVPFRERGEKRIETLEEAYQAALNFADYVD